MTSTDENIRQRQHLEKVIEWAARTQRELREIIVNDQYPVHFRPSSQGIAMIGLTPESPQRGRSGFRDLVRIRENFNDLMNKHCVNVPPARPTPEKILQSFLILSAKRSGLKRWMVPLNEASSATGSPAKLRFVTDELILPLAKGKILCDILALRETDRGQVPVVIELKSDRQMTRLVEQVKGYASLVDVHQDLFEVLFATILADEVKFSGLCEKWVVWPKFGDECDRREEKLAAQGIRVVGYERDGEGFKFRVGRAP